MINRAYWAEWADALLCAGAAGDAEAAGLYDIARRLAGNQNITGHERERVTAYILWVESKNADQ